MHAEILARFYVLAAHARDHARCGSRSRCRIDALAAVDAVLDQALAVEVHDVRAVGASSEHG